MKTVTILPESRDLVKYTHCASRREAEDLKSDIEELQRAGYIVTDASSARCTVPNSYKSAHKMHAPYYVFDPEKSEIRLVDSKLENRPKGAAIPARFEISGSDVPKGFRCFRRLENKLEIRRK